jgi:hypothetical protein
VFLLFIWRDGGLLFDLNLAVRCERVLVRPSACAGWACGASFGGDAAQRQARSGRDRLSGLVYI